MKQGADLPHGEYRELGQLFWSLSIPGLHLQDLNDEDTEAHVPTIAAAFDVFTAAAVGAELPEALVENLAMTMPWQFVLLNRERITSMLGAVEARSPEAAEELASSLFGAGIGGLHGRTMGQESPRVRRTIDLASEARDAAPAGSWAWKLYSDLLRWAEREAEDDRREDEETEWR